MLRKIIAVFLLLSSPVYADSLGSAIGGTAGNQSNMAGGVYRASPTVLTDGQQAGFAIDPTTHALLTAPAGGGGTTTVTQAALTPLAATQTNVSIASATALTIPATATSVYITANGVNNSSGICLYWRDDGTAPTGTTGQSMSAAEALYYKVVGLPIQLIVATSATCTFSASYYK